MGCRGASPCSHRVPVALYERQARLPHNRQQHANRRFGRRNPDDLHFHRVLREQGADQAPVPDKAMCIRVVEAPIRREMQDDGERVRFWAPVPELGGRFLRVVTLANEQTIHNAFPDRRFRP